MSDFKKLKVWQKAHDLAVAVHFAASAIRSNHLLALQSQLRRSAMSIPTNIVEGRGQKSAAEFARFLRFALNSAAELEYHLLIARDIGAIANSVYAKLNADTVEVTKMLIGLLRYLSTVPVKKSSQPPRVSTSPSKLKAESPQQAFPVHPLNSWPSNPNSD